MARILSGTPTAFPIDAHTSSSTKEMQLGSIGFDKYGNVYRYAKAGASDLNPGQLAVAATQVANHENLTCAAAAAGATEVTVTLGATAATANQYAEGMLVINDEDGQGIAYRISGHPAADASADLTVTIENPLQVALTTSSQASLVKNPWADIVISASDQADLAVGVPNVTIGDGEYGWVQTRGLCSVLADEAVNAGLALTIGSSTGGAVEAADGAGEQIVGVAHVDLVDTEYRSVFLTID